MALDRSDISVRSSADASRLFLASLVLSLGLMVAISHAGITQFDPPVRDMTWYRLETEHFEIIFHDRLEDMAKRAAEIAEAAWGPITDLYDWRPKTKTAIIVRDHGDIANGFAAYFQNKIEIWATSLDFEYRGTVDWLRNVITHEFTHIISLNATRKAPMALPQLYFQYFGLEREQRSDVAEGLPNTLISYAVPTVNVPMWFAEGVAQVQSDTLRHDWWDSHRDMILRTAVLTDSMLSYREMEGFYEKPGRGYELVYDHGFAFAKYIADTYGIGSLSAIAQASSAKWRFNFDSAIKAVTGKGANTVYREWVESMKARYERVKTQRDADYDGWLVGNGDVAVPKADQATIPDSPALLNSAIAQGAMCGRCQTLTEGHNALNSSYYHSYPTWSRNGSLLAYVSNDGQDYGINSIHVVTPGTDESAVVKESGRARSTISWLPDNRSVVFSKAKRSKRNRWVYRDLWRADAQTGEAIQLTNERRANYPDVSPDGATVVFVHNELGTQNMHLLSTASGLIRPLTDAQTATQFYTPKWSPDGKQIAVSVSQGAKRDLALVDTESGSLTYIVTSEGDDRDPAWSADGERLVFSSDIDGIFNLYELTTATGDIKKITNVIGGAFAPAVAPDGRIAYSSYEAAGYTIRVLPSGFGYQQSDSSATFNAPRDSWNPTATMTFDTVTTVDPKPKIRDLAVLPRVGVYDNKMRAGAYVLGTDMIDDMIVFGGGWANREGDYDMFVLAEHKSFFSLPGYIDYIRMVRHTTDDTLLFGGRLSINGIKYFLNVVDVGVRDRLPWGGVTYNVSGSYSFFRQQIKQGVPLPGAGSLHEIPVNYSYIYFKGWRASAVFSQTNRAIRRDSEINPQGWWWTFRYDHHYEDLFEDFADNSQILKEDYKLAEFGEVSAKVAYAQPMLWHDRHTVTAEAYGSFMEAGVDSFFYQGIGGIVGLKGYSYYSLQGRRTAWGRLTYRMPAPGLTHIDTKILGNYMDKVYLSVFAEMGQVWRPGASGPTGWKRDVGAEVRADLFAHYYLPARVSFSSVRALDIVDGAGDRWKHYLTVLFGYF